MKPCPYNYSAIWLVAKELDSREDGLGDSLLSGDAAVLLDFLTEKGMALLADKEQVDTDLAVPHKCLWFHWLVQHVLENTKRDFDSNSRNWMPLSDFSSWLEEHMYSDLVIAELLQEDGGSMPNDVYNVSQVLLDNLTGLRDTYPAHWRLYPQIQKALVASR